MRHAFIDKYSELGSPVHALDARAKSLAAAAYVLVVVLTPLASPGKFALYGTFILAGVVMSGVPLLHILKKIGGALPIVLLTVIFAPLLKEGRTAAVLSLGPATLRLTHEGLALMLGVIVKASLSVAAVSLLIGTTRLPDLLKGLEKLRVPAGLLAMASFMYRFIFVLTDDAQRLSRAFTLRSFGRFRLGKLRAAANIIGLLFIRTFERGESIYAAMVLRGYDGRIRTMREPGLGAGDVLFLAAFIACLAAVRLGAV